MSAPLRALRAVFAKGPAPARGLLEYAAPRLIAPRLPDFVSRYPDGRAFFLPRDPGPYAQIFTRGEFEPAESAAVRSLLRPGDLAVDVGANIGWFTLIMGRAVGPGGEVWAVEPMPGAREVLRQNLALNDGVPVRVFDVALGAEAGTLDLHLFEGLPHGHASASTLDREDYTTHRVERRPLDDLLDETERPPAFVKVDVEGSELDVLTGAARTIVSARPPIWMLEVNYETSEAFGYEPLALLAKFPEDHRVYRLTSSGLQPEADPASAPGGSNWIVVPSCHAGRVP